MADIIPIYEYSLDEARRMNERDEWTESHKANIDCAKAVEKAIHDNYANNCLGECVKPLIDEFGFDRVNWVLANTVQQNHSDGRYSDDNKRWARTFRIPMEKHNKSFIVNAHPGLVNLMIGQARNAWEDLGLFNYSHCEPENDGKLDYTRRVLVIDPRIFLDKYKVPDEQLFFATHGNGCRPSASGRKIFGFFLKDGEKNIYSRTEIIGILKDEYLPDWAREKLVELNSSDEVESEGITMGGI